MAKQIMDGCTAATHIAYALSDVATIYPHHARGLYGRDCPAMGHERT